MFDCRSLKWVQFRRKKIRTSMAGQMQQTTPLFDLHRPSKGFSQADYQFGERLPGIEQLNSRRSGST
jgi:hypothetical protein